MKKTMLLTAVCAAMFASAAWADSASGMRAYQAGLYDVAAQEFRREALKDNAEAQYQLGAMYADGVWFAKNRALAVEWLGKAAISGHQGALRKLEALSEPAPARIGR